MFDYVIVADDYTGAVETATKFMNGGYSSTVTLDPGSLGTLRSYSAVALDTETFFYKPDEAENKLRNVARNLLPWKGSTVFFKSIEAGLRGNVGTELRALIHEMGFEHTIVVPAFSRGRRAVEEGTVYLDKQERMSSLTVTTSQSASLEATVELLHKVGLNPQDVTLEDIRSGKITELLRQKKGCFCFDAETDEDLRLIVQGILKAHAITNVLWVGAVGLAEALATAPRPFLVVVGTAHPRSVRQARQLLEHGFAHSIPIQMDNRSPEGLLKARTQAADKAETLLRCGQSVLLIATLGNRFIRGSYPDDDLEQFMDLSADTVREIMGRTKIGGLCVTGGDCAVRIIQRVKADSVSLTREIQEGITLLTLKGGPFNGLPLISKSGALGGERALVYCMEYLVNNPHLGREK